MKTFVLFTAFIVICLPYGDFREYHYTQPRTPFNAGGLAPVNVYAQQSHTQNPPQIQARYYAPPKTSTSNAIIQNYGLSGTAHITRQLPTPVAHATTNNGIPTPYATSGTTQVSYNQVNPGSNYATVNAYTPQQQQQYTLNANPLIQYPQQQQPQQQHYTSNYNINGQQQHQHQVATGSHNSFGNTGQVGQTLSLNGNYVSQSEAGQLHSYQHQQIPIGDIRPYTRQISTCDPNGQCDSKTLGAGQADKRHQHIVASSRAKAVPVPDKCRRIAEAKKAQAAAGIGGSFASSSTNSVYSSSSYTLPTSSDSYAGALQADGNSHQHTPQQQNAQNSGSSNQKSLPNGQNRPRDRRLFPYSEVTLPNNPYN